MKRQSKTEYLAQWFVKEVLQREFDFRFDRMHLKAAKELVNPPEGAKPLHLQTVQICIGQLNQGAWNFDPKKLTSLHAVTWGAPPYYERAICLIKDMPPVYEIREYDTWVRSYGKIAIEQGFWDGAYMGYANPLELPFRIPVEELAQIMALA